MVVEGLLAVMSERGRHALPHLGMQTDVSLRPRFPLLLWYVAELAVGRGRVGALRGQRSRLTAQCLRGGAASIFVASMAWARARRGLTKILSRVGLVVAGRCRVATRRKASSMVLAVLARPHAVLSVSIARVQRTGARLPRDQRCTRGWLCLQLSTQIEQFAETHAAAR